MTGLAERSAKFGAAEGDEGIIRCDACPVLCRIRPGRAGACARYANQDGLLIRTDPNETRHRGLTWVICDMQAPGLEVRPIRTMAGLEHFAQRATEQAAQKAADMAP